MNRIGYRLVIRNGALEQVFQRMSEIPEQDRCESFMSSYNMIALAIAGELTNKQLILKRKLVIV